MEAIPEIDRDGRHLRSPTCSGQLRINLDRTGLRSIKAVMRDDHPTPIFLTLKRADWIAVQQILDRDHADGEHEKHTPSDHP
jgi:hypothetical protein